MLPMLATLTIFVCVSFTHGEQNLLLVLGGSGDPSVALYSQECDKQCVAGIPDVPQPYGAPGRTGSYAATYGSGDSVIVCGGLDASGPPISSFKDCQVLNLGTQTWSSMKMANYSAHGVAANVKDDFLIFGGENTRYDGPGPTEWVDHNQIQKLDISSSSDSDAKWSIMEELTLNNDSFLGSCAVVIDYKVYMSAGPDGTSIVSFDPETQKWETVYSNIGFSAKRHGCTFLELAGKNLVVFIGGDNDLAFAFEVGVPFKLIELPKTHFKRPHHPILTTVGSHVIVHGGGYTTDDFVTEEALDLNDLLSGWQRRTVDDVSRVDSPGVVISSEFFPDCSCEKQNRKIKLN